MNNNNLEAYKMDGLGNDFIIFDKRKSLFPLPKTKLQKFQTEITLDVIK